MTNAVDVNVDAIAQISEQLNVLECNLVTLTKYCTPYALGCLRMRLHEAAMHCDTARTIMQLFTSTQKEIVILT
jgi:hypothetical protein